MLGIVFFAVQLRILLKLLAFNGNSYHDGLELSALVAVFIGLFFPLFHSSSSFFFCGFKIRKVRSNIMIKNRMEILLRFPFGA